MTFRVIFIYVLIFQLIFTNSLQLFTPKAAQAADGITETSPQFSAEDITSSEPLFRHLYESLLGGHEANPLDTFSLLRQDYFKENANISSISPLGVMFDVTNEVDGNSTSLRRFRASESLSSSFDAKITEENTGFTLYIEGKPVHKFRVPVEALAVVGNFIVFIEKNSFHSTENLRQLSFIDLNYFHLGKAELPIFRVPVHGQETIESVQVKNNKLIVNETAYESGLFEFAAGMQRVIFNVLVNSSEPKHLTRLMDYIEPYLEYFAANLESAKQNTTSTAQIEQMQAAYNAQMKDLEEKQRNGTAMDEGTLKTLGDSFWKPLSESMETANKSLQKQRGLVGRLGLLWQRLSVPRPAEVSSLKAKLVQLAVGMYKRTIKKADLYEVAFELATNKKVKFSAATLSAAAFAYFMPEASLQAVLSVVEVGRVLAESAVAKGNELVNIGWETTKSTFSGLNPIKLYEAYIADGAWQRTSVGISAMFTILTITVGIPHLLVNSYYLIKDYKSKPTLAEAVAPSKLLGFLITFKHYNLRQNYSDLKDLIKTTISSATQSFIQRQQDLQTAYIS
ncbi:MAG: hypothetical protein KDD37_11825, partial [Bdellovibrionales bacterium]|nr:hypothetical protein [Bdellovibrionales bacterium]